MGVLGTGEKWGSGSIVRRVGGVSRVRLLTFYYVRVHDRRFSSRVRSVSTLSNSRYPTRCAVSVAMTPAARPNAAINAGFPRARARSSRSILALASRNRRRCRPESLSSRRHETRRSGCSTPSRGACTRRASKRRTFPRCPGREKNVRVGQRERPRRNQGQRERAPVVPFRFRSSSGDVRPARVAANPSPSVKKSTKPSTNPRNEVVMAKKENPATSARRRRRRRLQRFERIGDGLDGAARSRDRVQSILRLRLRHRPQKRGVPQHEHRERNRGARAEGELRFRRVAFQLRGHHRDDVVEHERERRSPGWSVPPPASLRF